MRSNKTLRGIMGFLRPHLPLAAVSVILSAASVLLTLYLPILIGRIIDCIIAKGNVDFAAMKPILLEGGVIILVAALLQWLNSTVNNKIAFAVTRDIRLSAFKKLQILPVSYLDRHPSGDILSRMITDADTFSDGLLLGFTQLFSGIMTIAVTLIFMFALNPIIAAAVVVITPLSLFAARFISKHTYDMFRVQSETRGEQTALIDEAIGNQKTVAAFSREQYITEKYNEIDSRLCSASLKATFFSSLVNPTTRFVNNLVYAAVGCFGALSVIGVIPGGSMSVGALSTFLSYANQYTKPFNEISGVITELQNAVSCIKRILEFLNEQPELPDADSAAALTSPQGNIEISDVSFSYNPSKELIKDFNLSVKSGQRVAIVGPTGCGKTTVINLLMRFYDVNSGSIKIDGLDIRDITRSSLRSSYGMVLQETWLKAGSIRDNIAFGRPDATEEEIINAAKASHAHSFIKRLPAGYDTVIGEDGGGFSGGQKQLLCIARVMLCLPPMLILDEATSSIDTRTEIRIQRAFSKLMLGRTSFIVAHRLSTVREADVILVMNNGHIEETGNHEQLMAKKGFYYKLYNSQFEQ